MNNDLIPPGYKHPPYVHINRQTDAEMADTGIADIEDESHE